MIVESKLCPKCKTDNPVVANFCRHCRYEFPESTKKGIKLSPEILSFSIAEHTYNIGSVIHFTWKVENADIVQINGIDVSAYSDYEFRIDKAETITLTAENDYDRATRSIRLSPKPIPYINSFTTPFHLVHAGQEVKLKWDVRNANKVILSYSGIEIDVTRKDYYKMIPTKTETYTLTCYADDNSIYTKQSLNIQFIAPVIINSFTADKDVITEADRVTLHWDVENAASVRIHPLMKDVTKLNTLQVSPSCTTEYVIEAQNMISQEKMSISIGVRQLPKVDMSFVDSFSKIEIPSCDINLSFLSDSMKKARIDEWMSTVPTQSINHTMWKLTLKNRLKIFIDKLRFTK